MSRAHVYKCKNDMLIAGTTKMYNPERYSLYPGSKRISYSSSNQIERRDHDHERSKTKKAI